MKNLKVFFQESIMIFAVLLFAACQKDVESLKPFVPTSLPYESLKEFPQTGDVTPSSDFPGIKSDLPKNSRYLTLHDASLKNVLVIKIKTDDKDLLSSLNEETVQLIALGRQLPGPVNFVKSKNNDLTERIPFTSLEIEIVESKIQKDVNLYGIKFVSSYLIHEHKPYEFIFKNSNVSAVYAIGHDAIKDPSRFTVQSSSCLECGISYLLPHLTAAHLMIGFNNYAKSNITLKVAGTFSEDIQILW